MRFLYWSSAAAKPGVGRSTIAGTEIENGWLPTTNFGIGVWANETHIFLTTNFNPKAIWRANLDGTEPDENFIELSGQPKQIWGDDTYLYFKMGTTIGRVKLDGTGLEESFITGIATAAASDHGFTGDATYLYWFESSTVIGRSKLDGTEVEHTFMEGLDSLTNIKVNDTFIYWGQWGKNRVGRANLDGTEPNENFIEVANGNVLGVAIDATYVYWSVSSGQTYKMGRANLDGTEPDEDFTEAGGLSMNRFALFVTPEAGVVKVVAPPATATASAPAPTLAGATRVVQAVAASATASAPVPAINATGVGTVNVWIDGKIQPLKRWVKVGGELLNR